MIWVIGFVVVVAGVIGVLVMRSNGDKNTTVTNTKTVQSPDIKTGSNSVVIVDACDVLTEVTAKNILGDAAAKGDLPGSQVSTKDVSVSSCVYTAKIDPAVAVRLSNTKGVSVLVRAAKTNSGSDSNKSQFGSAKPAGVQDVAGIGDAAFFNPQFGQLNVLKGGNWYILSNYSGGSSSGTVESNKKLADLLVLK